MALPQGHKVVETVQPTAKPERPPWPQSRATLLFTTAPAAIRESWPQRIEVDWLLAEEVAAQDQLGGLVTTKANAAGETLVQAAVE